MYIRNYFLKQPRRGKTREALITPYKRSAVWGSAPMTSSDRGDSDTGTRSAIRVCLSLVIVVLLALASPLSAQHRDTLYVVEEEPVYDTLFVHDTLRVHDTLVPMQTDSTGFYKFSAGLNVNVLGGGPSIKYGISKNCVFQTDFSGRFFINNYSPENSFILYVYELSQNFLYQRQIAEKNGVLYYYMVGAGLSGGVSILRPTLWKLGVYPLFGVEFVLKRPKLSFQIDLRAGYCSLLKSANAKPPRTSLDNNPLWLICYTGMPTEYPYHGYDISLNFAVRFCMIK